LDVFVTSGDANIYQQWYQPDTGWMPAGPAGGWVALGSPLSGAEADPSAVSWGPGHVDVFVEAFDFNIWYRRYLNGQWQDWDYLRGQYLLNDMSPPDAASRGPGRVDVVAIDNATGPFQGTVLHKWWEGGPSWLPSDSTVEHLGGPPGGGTGHMAAVAPGNDRLDIFVVGAADNAIWQRTWGPGWGNWTSLGTLPGVSILDGPDAASWSK
jgi:hypothetical protein